MVLKKTIHHIASAWNRYNVFEFKLSDSIAYMCLYIALPVFITITSLISFPNVVASAAYCYVSIMVSAINCIYDNALRWTPRETPSFKNVKLLCALIPNAVVALYCAFEIVTILIMQSFDLRCDSLLLVYVVPIFIATKDFVECVKQRVAGMSCIDELLEV